MSGNDGWICARGHTNNARRSYCFICGVASPATSRSAPPPLPSAPSASKPAPGVKAADDFSFIKRRMQQIQQERQVGGPGYTADDYDKPAAKSRARRELDKDYPFDI